MHGPVLKGGNNHLVLSSLRNRRQKEAPHAGKAGVLVGGLGSENQVVSRSSWRVSGGSSPRLARGKNTLAFGVWLGTIVRTMDITM